MNQVLKSGQTVGIGASGIACKVQQLLGGGGQGEVYSAEIGGQLFALKWYYPQSATAEQFDALTVLIRKGPPSSRFLWPMDIAVSDRVRGYGYIMPLRESRFRGIVDLMAARISPKFRTLATVGFEMASSFLCLHAQGLCYRDISFGNAFFDPDTGDVLICDNDNVAINGAAVGGVLGTPRFMAPEIVRGEARPSAQTDLYSLAVLLFYIFMVAHPLEGAREASIQCYDVHAMNHLFGVDPVFIYDPNNDGNRPVPGYHDNALVFWPIYPKFLRDLFTQAFTVGLHDMQHGRVHDSVWQRAMVRLRDAIFECPFCHAENFYDADHAKGPDSGEPVKCWACGKTLSVPPRIRIGRDEVLLDTDAVLHPHHIDDRRQWDFSAPVAKLVPHPTAPGVWGLENLTGEKWTFIRPGGTPTDVPPGKRAVVADGVKIAFGAKTGEIHL